MIGMTATLPFLPSCVSTESIPATELPSLARSMDKYPDGFHYVTRTDGKPVTLEGEVTRSDIVDQSGNVEAFSPPLPLRRSTSRFRTCALSAALDSLLASP